MNCQYKSFLRLSKVLPLVCIVGLSLWPNEVGACPAHNEQAIQDAARLRLLPPTSQPPTARPATATQGMAQGMALPEEVGRWLEPMPWPVIAIHAALLPTGQVLHYSYPADPKATGDVAGGSNGGSVAWLWSAESGFSEIGLDQDIFCSGMSLLPDGRLYVTGGNDDELCDFQGRADTHVYDPWQSTWTRLEDMSVARWYPSNTTLGDGRVVITSGLNLECSLVDDMEIFTPGQGLDRLPAGDRQMQLYPRLHLLTSGKIAHVAIERRTHTFDPSTGEWQYIGNNLFGNRWDSVSVEVPGAPDEILVIGGSLERSCERIDFAEPQPAWRETAPMHFARSHANAVLLPDGQVLVIGGGTDGLYGLPAREPEIYDPVAETWTVLPAQALGRMYHSTAVLLPDGRVLSAGQDDGASAYQAEIYEPAYLFRGPRPEILDSPTELAYGNSYTVDTPQASDIQSVVLIGLSSVTHSVNSGQRYVGLSFEATSPTTVEITAPPNGHHAAPGFYMLFVVNSLGVPSVARMVRLKLPEANAFFADDFESGVLEAWSTVVP